MQEEPGLQQLIENSLVFNNLDGVISEDEVEVDDEEDEEQEDDEDYEDLDEEEDEDS